MVNDFRSGRVRHAPLWLLAMTLLVAVAPRALADGDKIVKKHCFGCHSVGVMGAPKLGVAPDWELRLKQGLDKLVDNGINGINNMPARGGNPVLTDAEIREAVEYMVAQVRDGAAATPDAAKPKPKVKPKVRAAPAPPRSQAKSANKFNRLMQSKSEWNPPPAQDGIHDPANNDVQLLQSPGEAFAPLDKNPFGNHVDWVAALDKKLIEPRYDRLDPEVQPIVMDLNIVREVKGSMPDVVYPHKQHTEWLDCSNCHPAIFIPQKGANQISMASILMGQQCGVCHGKVAFPVSECRRCHSRKKTPQQAAGVNK